MCVVGCGYEKSMRFAVIEIEIEIENDALMIDYGVLSLSAAAANARASTEEVADE